jgi:hypothetical protein
MLPLSQTAHRRVTQDHSEITAYMGTGQKLIFVSLRPFALLHTAQGEDGPARSQKTVRLWPEDETRL